MSRTFFTKLKLKIKCAAYPGLIHLFGILKNVINIRKLLEMSRNKHKRNLKDVAVVQWLFHEWWLLKEPFTLCIYWRILLSKSSFKWFLCWCFEKHDWLSLFVSSNTTLLELQTRLFSFFPNLRFQIGGAAYLRMWLITQTFTVLAWNFTCERKSKTFVSSAKSSIYWVKH